MTFFEQVYAIVEQIPKGKVATYGQIAFLIGHPRSARMVGYALHVNPKPGIIPCHRVVNREGRVAPGFAFGGPGKQAQLLAEEGIISSPDGYVDLNQYLWCPSS